MKIAQRSQVRQYYTMLYTWHRSVLCEATSAIPNSNSLPPLSLTWASSFHSAKVHPPTERRMSLKNGERSTQHTGPQWPLKCCLGAEAGARKGVSWPLVSSVFWLHVHTNNWHTIIICQIASYVLVLQCMLTYQLLSHSRSLYLVSSLHTQSHHPVSSNSLQ